EMFPSVAGPAVEVGVGVGVGVDVSVGVGVGVSVGVGVGVDIGVGVGVGIGGGCLQYLPPVFKTLLPSFPPHTIISLPVQIAVKEARPLGALVVLVVVQ